MAVKKPVYLALAIRMDGQKELLGLRIERNEGAKFRLGIMNELKNRGVQDVLPAAALICLRLALSFADAAALSLGFTAGLFGGFGS